jgi:predicted RNA-binding Zn ribbon-like protein
MMNPEHESSTHEHGLNDEAQAASMQHLFIAFSNTLDWHASEHPVESLNAYADLVEWAVKQEIVTAEQGSALQERAAHAPKEAGKVLARAVELREAIYRTISASGATQPPAAADIAIINRELAQALCHLEVVAQGSTFGWGWRGMAEAMDAMLWPVVRSAAEQLVAEDLHRVKVCADVRGCGYMFYDETRNRSRRWCDMGTCGNRAKAQRHYQRHRTEQA